MNSQDLFQQGVAAIKEKDIPEGRRFIKQSLKLNPHNAEAWIWLARTENEVERKRRFLQHALKIAPDNSKARLMLSRLPVAQSKKGESVQPGLSADDKKQIKQLLKQAKRKRKRNPEGAVEDWVGVLQIQVDHPDALEKAVEVLIELGYWDDAEELLWRAIDAETHLPFAYQKAMFFAERHHDHESYVSLRNHLIQLPDIPNDVILEVIEDLVDRKEHKEAIRVLKGMLKCRPRSQPLLVRMGDFFRDDRDMAQALVYYNRAAQIGHYKDAEKRLAEYPPILTDRERRSILLAARETLGIGFFYLLLAWQDVELNLLKMDGLHWFGVVLAFFAGHLLITATTSPQQVPLAERLGGQVREHTLDSPLVKRGRGSALQEVSQIPIIAPGMRLVLGLTGAALLIIAFILVFKTSVSLLFNPIPPDMSF